ncbi:MAG TPA: chemotaxis protein CheB [Tepidisphaeraceae bacterium]|jgi:two-component system CheB/CheR fusion protein|nr:chemotaxis protein CheB [Tepidisphaeraceae bacterium]
MAKEKRKPKAPAKRPSRNHSKATPPIPRTQPEHAAPEAPLPLPPTDALESPASTEAPAEGNEFSIVGVGASAGGLEAFMQFLESLPADTGMAIILVQHLSPNHESVLPELLRKGTTMPVEHVTEGMEIRPDHVYVMPPNVHMGVDHGRFHLTPRPHDHTQHMPVDSFLRSLAEYAQSRAIGIILSGTAHDGAAGLKEVKAVGGITMAQSLDTAKYDGMPRSAIATGTVDMVLPPQAMAAELARISKHPLVRHVQVQRAGESFPLVDEQLRRIYTILRNATMVDFTHYKQPTIRRRLQRRMLLHKIATVDQYVRFLQQNPEEVQALYADILIHVTRFFREGDSFNTLTEVVFPAIISRRPEEGQREYPIRIWIPGCATGEEAYSVAISLVEFLGENLGGVPVQIFATDISESSINAARAGVYPESISADVSADRLRRFFTRSDGSYRINKQIRDMCVFARQDLTRDPPFSRLDLTVCRNVLIYLSAILQKKLMQMFHYALKPQGFLLLGSAETVGASADLFSVADKRHRLYIKKETLVRDNLNPAPEAIWSRPAERPARAAAAAAEHGVQADANRVVLEQFAPPGVIVDWDFQIVQFRGHTGPFLEPAPGDANLNVLKMAREGLLHVLRSALTEARREGKPTRKEGLHVKHAGKLREVNIEIIPLQSASGARHLLVLFDDVTSSPAVEPPPGKSRGKAKGKALPQEKRVQRLQQELAASRDYLQSIIQDLEAANEELQSANEEILSSNEELQSINEELDTAKEELQSTNEELNTLNEELHGRNEELSLVNSDLVNLLASVQIAIVMVSRDQRIRRFTPMAEKVLNLIAADVGRPITDIKPNIECPDLQKLISQSIDEVVTVEREAKDRHGYLYTLRIRPYKNLENRIDGAVLALFDLDGARRQELEAQQARELSEAMLETMSQPMVVLNADLRVLRGNSAFARRFERPASDGQLIYDVLHGHVATDKLRTLLEQVLPREGHVEEFDLSDGSGQPVHGNARRLLRSGAQAAGILLAIGK